MSYPIVDEHLCPVTGELVKQLENTSGLKGADESAMYFRPRAKSVLFYNLVGSDSLGQVNPVDACVNLCYNHNEVSIERQRSDGSTAFPEYIRFRSEQGLKDFIAVAVAALNDMRVNRHKVKK